MARPLRMPQPGQMTEECTVLAWHKSVGDRIEQGNPIYEIETDKSNMDVEAFDSGTLLAIVADEGATVPVDSIVAWIGAPGEAVPDDGAETAEPAASTDDQDAPASPPPADDALDARSSTEPRAMVDASETPPAETAAHPATRPSMSPRAARVAIELGVDPTAIAGTGPSGRIVERDVRTAAEGREASPEPTTPATQPDESAHEGTPERMSRLRRVIACRLSETAGIPTFTVSADVDLTDVVALRAELKEAASPVSITDLVHAAVIGALSEHPTVNAVTDGVMVWRREHVHLGVAVAVTDGLLVPVVRDADTLSLPALNERTREVVVAARDGRLGPDELSGSTFTVSNMGMYDVDRFSAIINPGESAILAVSSTRPRVVASELGIVTRQVMSMTLTADHRLVDGQMAASFVGSVRRRLEDDGGMRALLED